MNYNIVAVFIKLLIEERTKTKHLVLEVNDPRLSQVIQRAT